MRHGKPGEFTDHEANAETYPADSSRYCLCPGYHVHFNSDGETLTITANPDKITKENVSGMWKCCGAETGEDGLCERCRDKCKPVLDALEVFGEKAEVTVPDIW